MSRSSVFSGAWRQTAACTLRRLMVPVLALTLVVSSNVAVGTDLIADGAKHTLDLAQGQLQDLTIPAGFVGRVTLQAEGGDGGNGRGGRSLVSPPRSAWADREPG
jgi:hypothetical protein